MAKCKNNQHSWQNTAVFIGTDVFAGKKCVMLMRCKRKSCREFGKSYGIVPEPFAGSVNASLFEVPKGFREFLENFIAKMEEYPSYNL